MVEILEYEVGMCEKVLGNENDVLENAVEMLEDEIGIYEEFLGNENDVLENAEGKLVDGVEVGENGNNILGWNGCFWINGSVE